MKGCVTCNPPLQLRRYLSQAGLELWAARSAGQCLTHRDTEAPDRLVILGLTPLLDSISVYIEPSPREMVKEKRNDRR